jgi:hypothetical protein
MFLRDNSISSCMLSCCRWWRRICSLLVERRGSSLQIF